jgi:hypothetical protein
VPIHQNPGKYREKDQKLEILRKMGAWTVVQVVEYLPSKCKALSSNHSTAKENFKKEKLKSVRIMKDLKDFNKTLISLATNSFLQHALLERKRTTFNMKISTISDYK